MDNNTAAIEAEVERRLADINAARNIPETQDCAEGCFARNYRPTERVFEFMTRPSITVETFNSIEEIEESLVNAVEAMLIAGYSELEIIKTSVNLHLSDITVFSAKRLISKIKGSEHYAMLDALINHSDGYEFKDLAVALGIGSALTTLFNELLLHLLIFLS